MNKYGVKSYFQTEEFKEKTKNTYIKRYGVDSFFKTNEFKEKRYRTQKKNNTFNSSKEEDTIYNFLLENFKKNDIKRQYKSKKYPFACDFYIKSLDLFIEYNFHWTHGGHRFDKSCKDDLKIIEEWEKGNTKYYRNAINTWTKRDVEKRKYARKNKLNYIVFWSLDDIDKWFKLNYTNGIDWQNECSWLTP